MLQKKDTKAKEEAKAKNEQVWFVDKLPNTWQPRHHLGEPMLTEHEHVVKCITGVMKSMHEIVLYKEKELLKEKSPGFPLHVRPRCSLA
jgi:hypothetical protein